MNLHTTNRHLHLTCGCLFFLLFSAPAMAQTPVGVEAVDLGLSVYWASCNVGADLPEGYGSYYAWGETIGDAYQQGKTTGYDRSFDWQTYCGSESFKEWTPIPYLTTNHVLKAEYDAASVNWGSDWRMPNGFEMEELLNSCNWIWTENYNNSGVSGFIVSSTAKGNSNFIFLPAAGYRYLTGLDDLNTIGHYWTSSLDVSSPAFAWLVMFYKEGQMSGQRMENLYRNGGRSVRAVTKVKFTGIKRVEDSGNRQKVIKMLHNGQIVIEKDGVHYNVLGTKIK